MSCPISNRSPATLRITLGAIFAAMILARIGCASDWPMSRFDASRNANSPEELPAKLQLAWELNLPRLTPAWSDQPRMQFDAAYQPIVLNGRMIVGSAHDDSVAAYDLATGK